MASGYSADHRPAGRRNFALFDDLGIGFLATGKVYDAIKE